MARYKEPDDAGEADSGDVQDGIPQSSYEGPPPKHGPLVAVLRDTLEYARERDYTGWDYCDGMSNPIREALPFENRWINLVFQESIKRSPVNIRPLFGVEQRRNYMGAALFAMGNLNAQRLREGGEGGDELGAVDYEQEARELVDWLVETRRRGYEGFCGGHNHEIQHLDSKGVPQDTDLVATSFAGRALLQVGTWTGTDDLLETARTATDFVIEDMNYRLTADGAKVDYYLHQPDGVYIPNAAAIGARLFLDLYQVFDDEDLRMRGEQILDQVVACQTPIGGWTYTYPPESSHLSMDNHHNGFILESLLQHRAVVETDRYSDEIAEGLDFYEEYLFEDDGAPRWDESNSYPRDVHAAAQGILVFTYAGKYDLAEKILGWTLEHLYDTEEARFYYRKGRLHTRRVTLMRWCQAWMCFAISEYLTRIRLGSALNDGISKPDGRP